MSSQGTTPPPIVAPIVGPCGRSTVELMDAASGEPTLYEVRPGSIAVGDGGCPSGETLVSFEAGAADSTLRVMLDPENAPVRLGCGQQVSLTDGTRGAPAVATRARMFSVGTTERGGVRCRTFVGDATFASAPHEAEARFVLRAPVEAFAGLAERYEVARATLLAVVERSEGACRYDVLFTHPDGLYGVSLDHAPCDLGIEALEDDSPADMGPVRSVLEGELYQGRRRTHVLRDITGASASLAGSANDRASPCAVLLGFAAPFPIDALDAEVSSGQRSQSTEAVRFSTCEGPLAPLRAALRDMSPVTFEDE